MHKIDSAVITSCVYRTLHHGRPRALVQRGTVHERRCIGGLAIGRHGTPCAVLEPRAHLRTERHTPSAHTHQECEMCVCEPTRAILCRRVAFRAPTVQRRDRRAGHAATPCRIRFNRDPRAGSTCRSRATAARWRRFGQGHCHMLARRGAACSAAAITHVAKCDR